VKRAGQQQQQQQPQQPPQPPQQQQQQRSIKFGPYGVPAGLFYIKRWIFP